MIISKTPLRISFFGGGTDYPDHYEQHGGEVLNTSIDKYVYITVSRLNPLFDHRIRVAYSRTELVRNVDEIIHPSVRHCLKHFGIEEGIEISVTSDLPARSGLGSSSSFTVGLLHALHAFQERLISQEELAREAIHIEQKVICEKVGSQDQVAAALGGLRRTEFSREHVFRADPLPLSKDRVFELQSHLMVFFSGVTRYAEEVLTEQRQRTAVNYSTLCDMRRQVSDAVKILCDSSRSLEDFGALLHEGWELKRSLSTKISSDTIDQAYNKARQAGAIGGKLLGAGGGGFLLVFAPPDKHEAVRRALDPLVQIEVALTSEGSRIIYLQR